MCFQTVNEFDCGCVKPVDGTIRPCEYAKLKGMPCPDFQISADPATSKELMLTCMDCQS